MTDLEKIQDQLEKAMSELKEMDNEETQLACDYIEYANILVKKLILHGVVVSEAEYCECDMPLIRSGYLTTKNYCANCGKDLQ